jgi:predicted chitinase
MQATGKAKYKDYAIYLGKSVGETSDLMRSDNHYALDSALWVFATDKKLNPVADTGPGDDVIKKVTKIINGAYIGLPERTNYFRKFYSALTK